MVEFGSGFFIIAVLIIAIWVIIEIKRLRHKLFAMVLIGLILFTYISFTVVLSGQNINLKSTSGLMIAGKLYFSWIGTLFGNFKTITMNAVRMDWTGNLTLEQSKTKDEPGFWEKFKT